MCDFDTIINFVQYLFCISVFNLKENSRMLLEIRSLNNGFNQHLRYNMSTRNII